MVLRRDQEQVLHDSPHARINSSSFHDGFTLVEMLVTLVIVGLAATVAIQGTGIGVGDRRRAAQISARLGAEIGLLQAHAIRTGQTTRLALDPETRLFLSSRPGARPIPTAPLPVAVETENAGEIRFLADGGSSGGRIVLGSSAGREILSISTLTARVRREAGQ